MWKKNALTCRPGNSRPHEPPDQPDPLADVFKRPAVSKEENEAPGQVIYIPVYPGYLYQGNPYPGYVPYPTAPVYYTPCAPVAPGGNSPAAPPCNGTRYAGGYSGVNIGFIIFLVFILLVLGFKGEVIINALRNLILPKPKTGSDSVKKRK